MKRTPAIRRPDSSIERALGATNAMQAFMEALDGMHVPLLGTPEHRGMVQGKDMIVLLALAGFRAEQQHGTLKHFTAHDLQLIAQVLTRADLAGSLHLGVDQAGNHLPTLDGLKSS